MSEIFIIGSGPAGISASLYTARAGLATTVISKGTGALDKAEAIENYYGFAQPVSGRDLHASGVEGAKNVGVQFVEDEVVGLTWDDVFVIETTHGSYRADQVLLATGTARTAPPVKGLKELEGQGVSYCAVCDAFFYRGKDVAVLGAGEYALHEIAALQPVAKTVTLLTNGAEPTAVFPPEVTVDTRPLAAIEGGDRVEKVVFADGGELPFSGVFVAYGVAGSTALARKIGALVEGNRITVDDAMATSIPGLYAAGDCTGGLLQVAKAVYEGARAGTEMVKRARKSQTA